MESFYIPLAHIFAELKNFSLHQSEEQILLAILFYSFSLLVNQFNLRANIGQVTFAPIPEIFIFVY